MIAFTVVNEETDQQEVGNKPQATRSLVSRRQERGEATVSTSWHQMPGYTTDGVYYRTIKLCLT